MLQNGRCGSDGNHHRAPPIWNMSNTIFAADSWLESEEQFANLNLSPSASAIRNRSRTSFSRARSSPSSSSQRFTEYGHILLTARNRFSTSGRRGLKSRLIAKDNRSAPQRAIDLREETTANSKLETDSSISGFASACRFSTGSIKTLWPFRIFGKERLNDWSRAGSRSQPLSWRAFLNCPMIRRCSAREILPAFRHHRAYFGAGGLCIRLGRAADALEKRFPTEMSTSVGLLELRRMPASTVRYLTIDRSGDRHFSLRTQIRYPHESS